MSEMKVMLACDSPIMENLFGRKLKQEGIMTEHLDLRRGSESIRSKKEGRILLAVCTLRGTLEQNRAWLCRLQSAGTSVICIVGEGAGGASLTGKEGIKVLELPQSREEREYNLFFKKLLINIKAVYGRHEEHRNCQPPDSQSRWLVGIGASTGGPKALLDVLGNLPEDCCGIVVVQHLTAGFSVRLAAYLDGLCRMRVKEADPDEPVRNGTVYLAPDGRQTRVKKEGSGYVIKVQEQEKIGGFCPAVNCLFESLAVSAGDRAMGIILTGMGRDGAEGLLKMRRAGACTVGQDQTSSVIYSMPYEAMRNGGVERQLPVGRIGAEIEAFHRTMKKKWGGIPDGIVNFSGR